MMQGPSTKRSFAAGGFALLAAPLLACASPAAAQDRMPVIAGQAEGYDACGTLGEVSGLDPRGDGFLAVRLGPASDYGMSDKLYNGDQVHICDQRGDWLGIVYARESIDCGVSTPWPQPGAYVGPCRSGWVYGAYVEEAAG